MYNDSNIIEIRFFVKIRFSATGQRALAETVYFKNDMTFSFYSKWEWYFKYRAALLQVKHPKAFVEFSQGSYELILAETEYKEKLENLIRAAKSKITEFERKQQNLLDNWSEIFPIEQHPDWTKIVQKMEGYRLRLNSLTTEYELIK